MQSSKSLWTRSMNRIFGHSMSSPVPTKGRQDRRKTRRLVLETLENRQVFAADFDSAFGVGNATGHSDAQDVAVDTAGNSYITGTFTGTTDFDPARTNAGNTDILTARGGTDAFVAKYAPDNSLIWAKRMGGTADDFGSKIAVDGSGNVYVTGSFTGTGDFGSVNLTSTGLSDGFVSKLNSSGSTLWAKRWGAALTFDTGFGVGVDAKGNVYAAGQRNYQSYVNYGVEVFKFSPSGSTVWTKYVSTRSVNSGDMTVDAAGSVFVAAKFNGTVDFDPGSRIRNVSSGASEAAFVLKLTTKGDFSWVSPITSLSTTSFVTAKSLALDGGGNVIVGGQYDDSVDFDPRNGTTILPTGGGGYITKLSNTGALVWAKSLENGKIAEVSGLAVDALGSIYATGTFNGTIDLDPGIGMQTRTSAGGFDILALKLSPDGTFVWGTTIGGTGYTDVGRGIAVDSVGTVYIAGAYRGTVDFDPDPIDAHLLVNPGTFTNLYLLKLKQSSSAPLAAATNLGTPTATKLTKNALGTLDQQMAAWSPELLESDETRAKRRR
jgi:hypothetical protein